MEVKTSPKVLTRQKNFSCHLTKLLTYFFLALLVLIFFHIQVSPLNSLSSPTWVLSNWKGVAVDVNNDSISNSKLRDSITFLPLKDLRFEKTPMDGHTWFMSSLEDTREENEAEYLYFPSEATKERLLCILGNNTFDGSSNSYALAWPEALPESAKLVKGLTFISDTYYDHTNLWHGLCAMVPFVGWSMKNGCSKPSRWVLYHWGELRYRMGSWPKSLMKTAFGEVPVETFREGDRPYCFEKAVVTRHNEGHMGREKKLQVFDLLRCKARSFCGIDPAGKGNEVNDKGQPIIRLTLLLRRGSRSFKNTTVVINIFAKECEKVDGCTLKVAQSEDLSFCDQVRVLTNTDIVASPHGAQLTNMMFMDRNCSVMEFFPKGWLEHAGIGQYAHHPKDDLDCFNFFKDGQLGHNETHFAEWAGDVLSKVRATKLEATRNGANSGVRPSTCAC